MKLFAREPLRLPPAGALATTGPVDHVSWYYRPGLGFVMRSRLVWTRDAVFERPVGALLELGYGSGVFQYDLCGRSRLSVGLDVHAFAAVVRERLAMRGLRPALIQGDGIALPFAGETFDAVVIVSALEFVSDAELCLRECARVLRPAGRLVCLTPRPKRWADRVLQLLAGVEPESQFLGGRGRVQRALGTVLPGARHLPRPRWLPGALAPYELVVYDKPGAPPDRITA